MPEQPAADPYDLGDTDLHPRQEVEPWKPASSPVPSEEPAVGQTAAPQFDQKSGRYKDPNTGLFVADPNKGAGQSLAPSVEPPAHTHPQWLIEAARQMGYDEEDLSQPTEKLHRQIHRERERQLSFREEQALARTLQERPQVQPRAEEKPADEPIDWAEFNPSMAKVVQELLTEVTELKKFKQEAIGLINEIRSYQQQRQHESLTQAVDRLIGQHGDSRWFGEGSISQFEKFSAEAERRNSVVSSAKRMAGENAKPRDWLAMIPKAVALLGYGKPNNAAPARQAKPQQQRHPGHGPVNGAQEAPRFTQEQWEEAGLAAPSHRTGAPEPKGEALATHNLEKRMREQGQYPGPQEDKEILESLIDG